MKAFYITILSFFAVVVLFLAIKSRKLFKTLLFNGFLGLCVLAIINLTSKFSGLYIPLNWYSVGLSGVFGVPSVCLLLILQILF